MCIRDRENLAGDWKLECYFQDDEGNPTKSASATNKLLQETKVHVLIGCLLYTSRVSQPEVLLGASNPSGRFG